MGTGTLTIVPTPIGNLGDITLRAVEALRHAAHIVAEDTRHSRKLLSHLELDASRLSRLDAHALDSDREQVLRWLQNGEDVALITDAGTPAVSDPGTAMVRTAIGAGVPVCVLPGPSAVTTAVAGSGLVEGPFRFLGFPPRVGVERAKFINDLASAQEPCVLFESPERIEKLLEDLASVMGARRIVIARELSKMHEEWIRGTVAELAEQKREEWLGEITVVLGVWETGMGDAPNDEQIDARIDEELAKGAHTRSLAEKIAAWSGRPKREIYERVVERKSRS